MVIKWIIKIKASLFRYVQLIYEEVSNKTIMDPGVSHAFRPLQESKCESR